MKYSRLFHIIYALMEEKNVTAGELAERFEVSVRTIHRDIEALSMAGIPIYASRGRGGGISLMEEYVFDKSLLTEAEQKDILAGLRGISALGVQGGGEALQKLSALFGAQPEDWILTDFSDWSGVQDRKFEIIREAILEKKRLSFMYFGTSGEQKWRRVEPLQLWFKYKSWYVKAFCCEKQAMRLFKLSRMQLLQLEEEGFAQIHGEMEEMPCEGSYEAGSEKNGSNLPYTTFRIAVDATEAYRVYDENPPSTMEVKEDGSFLLTLHCPLDEWILGYVLSFGPHAELLEPKEVRSMLREYIEATNARYLK